MFYLSQMLGKPVVASDGEKLGRISDLGIAAGEMFPRVTSVAFKGPSNTPLMISWRKFVEEFDGEQVLLNVDAPGVRFSYLQPDEILLSRDLMSKQIVDTHGLKVVRVNDLKFSMSRNQLRLLGAEVGVRGILRGLAPWVEKGACSVAKAFHHPIEENIIAWNYMELLERDLSEVKLAVSHRRLHELHPADIADIIEQLDPAQRSAVFEHLDNAHAAEAISELEDEYQSDVIDDLSDARASKLLAQMDPDDAADIIGDLPYEKAEALLHLMGVSEAGQIRKLLGYKEKTAGGIMTTEFFAVPEGTTVGETIERLRKLADDHEPITYVYVTDEGRLTGVLSMRTLVLAHNEASVSDLAYRELITVNPDEDQEEVADEISKYSIMAMPVVDEDDEFLGIVTFDDAFEVLEEEHDEDLAIAGAARKDSPEGHVFEYFNWLMQRELWFVVWAVAALVCGLFFDLSAFGGALILMPLALIVAGDIADYAAGALIDSEGEELRLGKLIGRDLATGLAFSLVFGLACACLLAGLTGPGYASGASTVISLVSVAILPTAINLFVMIALTAPLASFASNRRDKGKVISGTRMSVFVMALAAVLELLLAWGCAYLAGIAMVALMQM